MDPDLSIPPEPITPPAPLSLGGRIIYAIRSRIVGGLLFMLPIVITFWVVYWVYSTFRNVFLDPAAGLVNRMIGRRLELPDWWQTYMSPVLAVVLALGSLYVLGYFVRSRISRAIDWVLTRVPGVTLVYKAVRNVFQSLQTTGGGSTFKRVVLVPFPHPGSRALSFVTKTLHDTSSGETILCVWVLTGVMPPAGFVLFVPEKEVTEVPWSVNDTLQIILSGGITAPGVIPYTHGMPGLIIPGINEAHRQERRSEQGISPASGPM